MPDFSELPLDPRLLPGLDATGLVQMTPVQATSLPGLLDGRDLIAQAPTGSGKTAAFGLAVLHRLDASQTRLQALVLCPTRELAEQVARQLRRLGTGIPNLKLLTLTGGAALEPQLSSLTHAPHVVVGTPGRVQELMRKKVLDLRGVRMLVLDEADRMLDMGFEDQIREIIGRTPKDRQTMLFSATYPDAIREVAKATMRDPVEVTVAGEEQRADIQQAFYEVEPAQRTAALAGLLLEYRPESAIVFCNMRRDADEVAASLVHLGFPALALHGDMEQRDREEVLVRFSNRSCTVLVASDVAARGLDIEDLALVVNHELPSDADTYVHRIGRTGRAGRRGHALSLCSSRELPRLRMIEEHTGIAASLRRPPLATLRSGVGARAPMVTLRIDGGKTDKLRPGDIVGALTGEAGIPGDALGRIDIFPTRSYIAVARAQADTALGRLQEGRIKGRRFRVRRIQ